MGRGWIPGPLKLAGILALCLLLCVNQISAQTAPLRVGLDSNYPPFSRLDMRGHAEGFDLEVAVALCAAMHRRCDFIFQPLDHLLESMRNGKLDLVMGVSETDDRLIFMDFSAFYLRARSIYIGKTGDTGVRQGTVRVGARQGSVQNGYLRSCLAESGELVQDEFGRLLDMLCAGELDMVLANDLAAYFFLLSERGQDFDVLGDPLPLDSFPSLVRIGVRKGEDELRQAVDHAIRDIRFSGAFGRINRSYFPYTLY